ncbi:hypothetical protein GCM10011368_10410 [Hyunsoonleella pacifica]|nr:hypothetical protein GCM10011368_10410 [Hyunsoonleella pacifica]
MLLGVAVIFFSCQNDSEQSTIEEEQVLTEAELLAQEAEILVSDGEEDPTFEMNDESEVLAKRENSSQGLLTFGSASRSTSSDAKEIEQEYKVSNIDRCDGIQATANFWWPSHPTDWNNGLFKSEDDYQLKFVTYTDGTANISGQTKLGSCVLDINVWLKDKKDWEAFSAPENGGSFKDEENDCTNVDHTILDYYVIDSSSSTITATGGDCWEEGTFGVEQRPDPSDDNTPHLGVLVGKGGSLFDSNSTETYGLSTWGWLTDDDTGARKYIMDFNFNIEPIEQCDDCKGDVDELTLKYEWLRKKRVRVYQKYENTCYGKKIFDGYLEPGEEFSIEGINHDGSFGKYIYIYIGHCYYTKIKTNCYLNIGPGYERGVFTVVNGTSTHGGELCDYVKPKPKNYCRWWWYTYH